eukprot:CAMPEP_0196802516 /NCGR_PEP_ID=MMETSP1362-20130617/2120_1 /TAXON_ID=163516 /ORGANISM="Leptocylindrus danicus, Strain CCMP1856" /LENGTH=269 /DNA_ID=CAMNT_0042173841 /DNA_START=43 /DNA_END=852 /DNA_ORIENTATION=-
MSSVWDDPIISAAVICVVAVASIFYLNRNRIMHTQIDAGSSIRKSKGKQSSVDEKKIDEKPFESSYYYAHNSSRQTGGYTDGLKLEDYKMNGPRLLSKSGVPVKDAPVVVNKFSAPGVEEDASSLSDESLAIKKFGWEDTDDAAKIRIENLPKKGSIVHSISWEEAKIPKTAIEANLINDDNGVLVKIKGNDGQDYHLRVPRLYGMATEVKAIRKVKRLIVKISKKNSRSWSSLASTTPDVDESEFLSDLPDGVADPTNFTRREKGAME